MLACQDCVQSILTGAVLLASHDLDKSDEIQSILKKRQLDRSFKGIFYTTRFDDPMIERADRRIAIFHLFQLHERLH
jgi:hypothetical protein